MGIFRRTPHTAVSIPNDLEPDPAAEQRMDDLLGSVGLEPTLDEVFADGSKMGGIVLQYGEIDVPDFGLSSAEQERYREVAKNTLRRIRAGDDPNINPDFTSRDTLAYEA